MPDNDFWIGQEQIPVDLSLLLTYHNDEDYWYAPGEYALRVYTVDTLNTNFARPCFALGERKFDPEMEDVSGAIENTLHELLDSGATPEDVYRIMGLVKESELSPETKEADSYLPIDLGYCIDGNIVSYEAVPEGVATVPENVDYPRYAEAMESHVPLPIATQIAKLYSLAGAEFSIYDASGKFVQKLTTNEKGETGRSGLLTAGTYTVKETKAPEGYYAADDFTVTVNAGQVTKKTVGDKPYNDPLAMLVGKFDGEKTYNGAGNLPQGSATLADAEFTVDYYDTFDYDNYDALKKADIEPTRSWTFKTDADGFSYFDTEHFVSGDAFFYNEQNNICIPRGTIVVRETKAPTGYLKSNAVSFQKIMEGSNTEALKTYNLAEVPEQVYRSDFEFTKKAENGSDRLAGVPFKVTSLTTGESHIAVTDENGYFSSASSWNAHDGKLHGIGHVPVEHLVRHVPPAIRVSDRGGGEADHLGALVRIEDVRNTLSPFLRTAVVKLVCNHNVVTGNLLTASCCHHRRAVCHELQVLGREPRRNLGKVRHLVVEHVIVGAEQQEPLVWVVLHHLCEDDELSRSGRLDDAGAVALPKHI